MPSIHLFLDLREKVKQTHMMFKNAKIAVRIHKFSKFQLMKTVALHSKRFDVRVIYCLILENT